MLTNCIIGERFSELDSELLRADKLNKVLERIGKMFEETNNFENMNIPEERILWNPRHGHSHEGRISRTVDVDDDTARVFEEVTIAVGPNEDAIINLSGNDGADLWRWRTDSATGNMVLENYDAVLGWVEMQRQTGAYVAQYPDFGGDVAVAWDGVNYLFEVGIPTVGDSFMLVDYNTGLFEVGGTTPFISADSSSVDIDPLAQFANGISCASIADIGTAGIDIDGVTIKDGMIYMDAGYGAGVNSIWFGATNGPRFYAETSAGITTDTNLTIGGLLTAGGNLTMSAPASVATLTNVTAYNQALKYNSGNLLSFFSSTLGSGYTNLLATMDSAGVLKWFNGTDATNTAQISRIANGTLGMGDGETFAVDHILEKVADHGVVIETVTLKDGNVTGAFIGNLTGNVTGNLTGSVTGPVMTYGELTGSGDEGTPGMIKYKDGYAYFCVATNLWGRVQLESW